MGINNRNLIEFVLYHEEDIKKAVYERRFDSCIGKTGGCGSGHCIMSDPTAQTAIKHVAEIRSVLIEYGAATCGKRNTVTVRNPEKWLRLISYTRTYYQNRTGGRLFEMRYTKNMNRSEIMEALQLSASQYHALLNDVLRFTEGVAIGIGIFGNYR